MPGGPASSTTCPATNPPPKRRSSSGSEVGTRFSSALTTSASLVGEDLKSVSGRGALFPGPAATAERTSTASSAIVFQAPHSAHCPAHLGEAKPQSWQRNTAFNRDMV